MALLIISADLKAHRWVKHIEALDSDLEVRVWPDVGDPAEIEMALVWKHPPGELKKLPNLKCIASLGIGVDHVFRDAELPANVPITRVVSPSMARSMSEYVVLAALDFCRQGAAYRKDQRSTRWQPRIPRHPESVSVGIMGMGQLGRHAAGRLQVFGFSVSGWCRTPKSLANIDIYAGDANLAPFLADSQILVCLLPLTPATRNILNARLFAGLPRGAYVINVARGEHLVEADLLAALESGQLSGACLDVFRSEPLPPEHPFWRHPAITVTPHVSSITFPRAVAPQIVDNYRRLQTNRPLRHRVDTRRRY